ncbi:MAG: hypothetical protein JO021_13275 [Alphaproteobacteria bacterium]|nr:hypothetical protein [Alphaproteobacteria bacterium]
MAPPDTGLLQARLAAAQALIAERRFAEAESALRALLADHPPYLQAKFELATALTGTGALQEAIGLFLEVCAVDTNCFRSDEFVAAIAAVPDTQEALGLLGAVLPLCPWSTKMVHLLGELRHRAAAAAGAPHGDIDAIGDSHAIHNFSPIVRCRVHPMGQRTLHRVAREPLDLAALGIAPGATVVTTFGEIDCRFHMIEMAKQPGVSADALALRVARGFVRSLGKTIARDGVARAAICAILPPTRDFVADSYFPVSGSAAERRDMAQAVNQALADQAAAAGIGFLDIRPGLVDADGFLDPAKSDGFVHLDYRHTDGIAARLDALFGPAS